MNFADYLGERPSELRNTGAASAAGWRRATA